MLSYSRYASKYYITGVYIAINDSYREVTLEMQVSKVKFIILKEQNKTKNNLKI
jgi:hypothetical protein